MHVRSGRCGECHLSGSVCDVRVTQGEWSRLKSERERLLKEIETARRVQRDARKAEQSARRAMDEAFEDELRLRREMKVLENDAEDAIAVEEANIEVLERQEEVLDLGAPTPGVLALSPHTWSAGDGLPDQFWAPSSSTPWVLS